MKFLPVLVKNNKTRGHHLDAIHDLSPWDDVICGPACTCTTCFMLSGCVSLENQMTSPVPRTNS